jgi:protein SCO1/2
MPLPLRRLLLGVCLPFAACGAPAPRAEAAAADSAALPAPHDGASLYALPGDWTDQRGQPMALAALRGRPQLVAMVYTSCTATCPLIVAELQRIEASLDAAQRAQLGVVLVSLDPDRDTPGMLQAYAERSGMDTARWVLLRGSDADVRAMAGVLDERYRRMQGGEIAHTNGITLLDRDGVPRHHQERLGDNAETSRVLRGLLR